jgi:acyl carrier protein
MSTVRDDVVALITELCRPEKPDLHDDDRPLLECGLDSVDFASLLMALEDRYTLTITEDDMDRLRTLGQIVGYLERHVRA